MTFSQEFLDETKRIANSIDIDIIEAMAEMLANTKGRLFILGVGGSAANASHAVNDFRKICGLEAYTPTDNVAELTARTNDDGWGSTFEAWLKGSHLTDKDVILVLSVGGGSASVSTNIVGAVLYAKSIGCKILGIVGKTNGVTQRHADVCLIVPDVNPKHVTPHTESWQSIILHLLVSHPLLRKT
jgi:D-sedoheptulose 7-phosphate isomerase